MSTIATCSCNQLHLTIEGELPQTSMCHCVECRRRTGSAFGLQIRVPKRVVSIRGEPHCYTRRGDEGEVRFSFCPECGTTLFWEVSGMPDSWIVAAGALAVAEIPAPTFSVYEDRIPSWLILPDSIETHMA